MEYFKRFKSEIKLAVKNIKGYIPVTYLTTKCENPTELVLETHSNQQEITNA
jgi:hypothetical protein